MTLQSCARRRASAPSLLRSRVVATDLDFASCISRCSPTTCTSWRRRRTELRSRVACKDSGSASRRRSTACSDVAGRCLPIGITRTSCGRRAKLPTQWRTCWGTCACTQRDAVCGCIRRRWIRCPRSGSAASSWSRARGCCDGAGCAYGRRADGGVASAGVTRRRVRFDDLVHSGFKGGESERLLQEWRRARVPAHRLVILDRAPLRVHRHLRSVEASMKARGDEARRVAHRGFGRVREQFNEPPLIRGLDGEHVDERDQLHISRDRGHGSPAPCDSADGSWIRGHLRGWGLCYTGRVVPYRHRVLYGDTDQMGVVYYGNYLRF